MLSKLTGYAALLGYVCLYLYGDRILGVIIFPSVYLDAEYAFHLRKEHLARFLISGLLVSSLAGAALGGYFVILRSRLNDVFFKNLMILSSLSMPVIGLLYTSYLYVNHIQSWHYVLFDFTLLLTFVASITLVKILD